MTRAAKDADGARAAFTRVAAACDKYVDTIVELTSVRAGLVDRRDDQQPRHRRPGHEDRAVHSRRHRHAPAQAETLQGQVDRLNDDIMKLWEDVAAAEEHLDRCLPGGGHPLRGSGRPDRDTTNIASLRAQLTALGGDTRSHQRVVDEPVRGAA
jgi:hypothetical protein